MRALVVVESATKARTLAPLLGRDYQVVSSDGPVVDLPRSRFDLTYGLVSGAKKRLAELHRSAADKSMVFFATDPDPGGEAVAWSVAERLGVPRERLHRVLLEEVSAAGFRKVHELNLARYEAQLARRAVDRITEFHVSEALGPRIPDKLTIDRLQAAALRLLVSEKPWPLERPSSGLVTLVKWAAASRSYSPRRTVALAQRLYERGFITFPRSQGPIRPTVDAPAPAAARLEPDEAVVYSLVWFPPDPTVDLGPSFTAAGLVAALEDRGAARAWSLVLGPELVIEDESRRLRPTDLAREIVAFLAPVPDLLAVEAQLAAVEAGATIAPVVREFREGFLAGIEAARHAIPGNAIPSCPKCGGPLRLRRGTSGERLRCHPCRFVAGFNRLAGGELELQRPEPVGRDCPDCGLPMEARKGRHGVFAGCSGYPACRTVQPINLPERTGDVCPACGEGDVVVKLTYKRRSSYGCSRYPACRYRTWDRPTKKEAPCDGDG